MTSLMNFLIIYAGALLINLIISAILWLNQKSTLYRSVFFLWSTSIFSFLIQGSLTQNDFLIAIGFSSAFLINISLSHLLSRTTGISVPWKLFISMLLVGYLFAIAAYFLKLSFTLIALPIAVTVCFPAFYTSLKVLLAKWNSISISLKCLAITTFVLAIHNIDYAFLRKEESFILIGFIIAFLVVFCLSIFTPAVVMEDQAEKINTLQKEKLDVQQQAIAKMKRIDELKDEFLANTSHELKTPIHGIIGLSESLLEQSAAKQSDFINHNLSLIAASGKRLASLVDDILVFSKLKHEELSLDLQPLKLKSIVDVVLNLSRPLVRGKNILLVNSVPAGFPPILADENRFQQILFNLIGNAIKYTDSGQVEISTTIHDNFARIAVMDTGIGIERDKQSSIFSTFEQLDGSASRSHGGVGLGLAISKKLVEIHQGTIWVESEPGKGSVFYLTMPLSKTESIQPANTIGQFTSIIQPEPTDTSTEPNDDSFKIIKGDASSSGEYIKYWPLMMTL